MKVSFTTIGLAIIVVCVIVGALFPDTIALGITVWTGFITFGLLLFNVFTRLAFNYFGKDTFFKIKKGRHYCQQSIRAFFFPFYRMTTNKETTFTFRFINAPKTSDTSWNKLAGLRYGLLKDNSVRLAWRRCGAKIEVAPYFHIGGKFIVEENNILKINVNQEYSFKLKQIEDEVWLSIYKGTKILTETYLFVDKAKKCKFLMLPYYGGRNTAPEEVLINIDIK